MNEISQVWLITGCSSGLGRSLALKALTEGHRVIATSRRMDALEEMASTFPETCHPLELDVRDGERVKVVVKEAHALFGKLDVVVNNAGYGLMGAFEELSDQEITQNFETNFFGALDVIRTALPILRAQHSGCIVNISAAAVISNYPGFSIYGATKWALEGVSESLAAELKPLGIHVMIVQPGPFRTAFIERSLVRSTRQIDAYDSTSGKFSRLLESMDGKQPGDPDKAASAIFSAIESGAPPLRLVLGKYATDKTRRKLAGAERELAKWEPIALSTEYNS